MQRFCQRNLLGMFFPRKKDESFALSTCSGLSWLMVIRGWRWPSTCITWDASRSSSAGRLLSGESRKALTTRCLGLSPSFSTDSSSIQQTLASSLCSAHTIHHQAHIKTYHFCDFLTLPSPWPVLTSCPGFLSFFLALCSLGLAPFSLMVIVPGPTCFERLPRHN